MDILAGHVPVLYAAQKDTVRTIKSGPGRVAGWFIYNPNTEVSYVQFFDTTSAVSLGSTVPTMVLGIPASSGANMMGDGAIFFTGIKMACTTTATGATPPTTGLEITIFYQ